VLRQEIEIDIGHGIRRRRPRRQEPVPRTRKRTEREHSSKRHRSVAEQPLRQPDRPHRDRNANRARSDFHATPGAVELASTAP
jgi:hypothetical protein